MICQPCRYAADLRDVGEPQTSNERNRLHAACINDMDYSVPNAAPIPRAQPIKACSCQHRVIPKHERFCAVNIGLSCDCALIQQREANASIQKG